MDRNSFEIPDSLKSEHLREGEKPITTCIGSFAEVYAGGKAEIDKLDGDSVDINYSEDCVFLNMKGIKNDGDETYVISKIDQSNKKSSGYFDCTGLIVSGRSKTGDGYVSFLTHQDPKEFLKTSRDKFIEDLDNSLEDMKVLCEEGTIDAIVLCGKYDATENGITKEGGIVINSNYADSIKLLDDEVKSKLGFEPVIVGGPKHLGYDKLYFDNNNRRAFLLRSGTGSTQESFVASDFDSVKEGWK